MIPRTLAALVGLLAVVSLSGLASAATESGAVRQGETDSYSYGGPGGDVCDQTVDVHTATLKYGPATDVLSLSVGALKVYGVGGQAHLVFIAGSCSGYSVSVAGVLVGNVATYTLTVS